MNKINVAATIPPPLPHVCVSFLLQGLDRPSAASRTQRRGERTPHTRTTPLPTSTYVFKFFVLAFDIHFVLYNEKTYPRSVWLFYTSSTTVCQRPWVRAAGEDV